MHFSNYEQSSILESVASDKSFAIVKLARIKYVFKTPRERLKDYLDATGVEYLDKIDVINSLEYFYENNQDLELVKHGVFIECDKSKLAVNKFVLDDCKLKELTKSFVNDLSKSFKEPIREKVNIDLLPIDTEQSSDDYSL